jgi:hypothetical protein
VSNVSQNVGSHISSTFNGAVQNAGSAWSNLTANVGEKWNELTNTSKVVAGNLGESINKAFGENGTMGNWTSHVGSVWSSLMGNMGEKWNELTNTSKNVTGNLGQGINKAFSENGAMGNMTSYLGSVWSSLKDNVGEKWNELTNTSKVVAGNLGQDIKTAFGENGAVRNFTSRLGSTLEQKFSELKALASKVKDKLLSEFSNATVIEKIATVLNGESVIPYMSRGEDCLPPPTSSYWPKNCDTTSYFTQNPKKYTRVPLPYVFAQNLKKSWFFFVNTPIMKRRMPQTLCGNYIWTHFINF